MRCIRLLCAIASVTDILSQYTMNFRARIRLSIIDAKTVHRRKQYLFAPVVWKEYTRETILGGSHIVCGNSRDIRRF